MLGNVVSLSLASSSVIVVAKESQLFHPIGGVRAHVEKQGHPPPLPGQHGECERREDTIRPIFLIRYTPRLSRFDEFNSQHSKIIPGYRINHWQLHQALFSSSMTDAGPEGG